MKILIIGDPNHQFIVNFVKDLRNYYKFSVKLDILSTSSAPLKKTSEVYDQIFSPIENSKLMNIRGFRIWWKKYLLNKAIKSISANYDICNIHYVDRNILPLISDLRKISKKIICSVWGSDLYRASESVLKKQKEYYNQADIITFVNKNTLEYFDKYFHINKSKYKFVSFHLKPLEAIVKINHKTKAECKKFFHLDPNKITITIGYSASPGAQHIRILNSLKHNKKLLDLKDNICFLLPLTYPKIDNYLSDLENKLSEFPFQSISFTQFMKEEEVAYFRKATDIFIILTITDQLSGSLLEHLYAQSVVLAGEWLPYSILEDKGIYFKKVSQSFDNLSALVLDTIKNLDVEKSKCIPNSGIIETMNDLEKIMSNWADIYSVDLSDSSINKK